MDQPNTKTQLIRAGLAQIHQHSYNGTGILEVLTAVKVPKGSFYHYFESKEAFGRAIVAEYARQAQLERETLIAQSTLTPLQTARKLFEVYLEAFAVTHYKQGCLLGNLSAEMIDHSEVLRLEVRSGFEVWQQQLAGLLEQAVAVGELPQKTDCNQLAAFCLNSWEGAVLRMRVEQSPAPLKLCIETIFDLLLKKR